MNHTNVIVEKLEENEQSIREEGITGDNEEEKQLPWRVLADSSRFKTSSLLIDEFYD